MWERRLFGRAVDFPWGGLYHTTGAVALTSQYNPSTALAFLVQSQYNPSTIPVGGRYPWGEGAGRISSHFLSLIPFLPIHLTLFSP